MPTEPLTEEQIKDIQEVRDGLLIPLRPIGSATAVHCQCGHCRRLKERLGYQLETTDDPYGPNIIPTLAGKISTKIRR